MKACKYCKEKHWEGRDYEECLEKHLDESNRLYDECLKIAESHQSYSPQPNPSDMDRGWKACARDIAESIRQLKQTEKRDVPVQKKCERIVAASALGEIHCGLPMPCPLHG